MEHELFQSELKSSVDGVLISGMIRSSSSGLNSHRAAAMELILERSIQDRRERVLAEAGKSLRSDPTPQPKSRTPDISTSRVQSSQLSSQSLPNDTTGTSTSLAWASVKHETSQDSSALSKPVKNVKVARREEPPAGIKTNSSPPEVSVKLACSACGVRQLRNCLRGLVGCGLCTEPYEMKCTGCGTPYRVHNGDACPSCHGKFK